LPICLIVQTRPMSVNSAIVAHSLSPSCGAAPRTALDFGRSQQNDGTPNGPSNSDRLPCALAERQDSSANGPGRTRTRFGRLQPRRRERRTDPPASDPRLP
jgi:nucleoid-associated protein YgaU